MVTSISQCKKKVLNVKFGVLKDVALKKEDRDEEKIMRILLERLISTNVQQLFN